MNNAPADSLGLKKIKFELFLNSHPSNLII